MTWKLVEPQTFRVNASTLEHQAFATLENVETGKFSHIAIQDSCYALYIHNANSKPDSPTYRPTYYWFLEAVQVLKELSSPNG